MGVAPPGMENAVGLGLSDFLSGRGGAGRSDENRVAKND